MGLILNRRREMGGKSLPYDAQIEYIEATGTQWIDTGFKATNGCIFDFEGMWMSSGCLVGSHNPSSNSSNGYNRNMAYVAGTNVVQFNKCSSCNTFSYTCSFNTKYHFYYNSTNRNRIGAINGTTIVNETSTSEILNPVNNVVCFIEQYGSTNIKGRIYYLKLYNSSSTLVRDMIPVRVGQVGYLYDKVTNQLFGNSGTGNFTLGPDV